MKLWNDTAETIADLILLLRPLRAVWRAAIWGLADGQYFTDEERHDYFRTLAEQDRKAESELVTRYPDAASQRRLLTARAQGHGVLFSQHAGPHHQAAILDHLDNPSAPTLLRSYHMTWVYADQNQPSWRSTYHQVHLLCAKLAQEASHPKLKPTIIRSESGEEIHSWRKVIDREAADLRRYTVRRGRLELH